MPGADVVVLGRRDGFDEPPFSVHCWKRHADGDEAVRVRVRERPQDDAVDHAVDERIRANPQRERHDDHERDARALADRPPGVANVRASVLMVSPCVEGS
jgi:hypothetical protein